MALSFQPVEIRRESGQSPGPQIPVEQHIALSEISIFAIDSSLLSISLIVDLR